MTPKTVVWAFFLGAIVGGLIGGLVALALHDAMMYDERNIKNRRH